MQRGSARQNLALCIFVKVTLSARSRCTTCRRRSPKRDGAIRWLTPRQGAPFHASSIRKRSFTFPTPPQIREYRRSNQDLCSTVGASHPECAAVPRDRGKESTTRRGEPAQVAIPRQYEPRAAHAAQCHPRL